MGLENVPVFRCGDQDNSKETSRQWRCSMNSACPRRRPQREHRVVPLPPNRVPHVLTVTSGKGGVGKTNFTANLGWLLRQTRSRVLLLDANLGLANLDIVLGLSPAFNIGHVLSGEKTLKEVLIKGPAGLSVLPSESGSQAINGLSGGQKIHLLEEIEALRERFDYLLIDTGAGIDGNVVYFNLVAQTIIVLITPERTSIADAFALIKVLANNHHRRAFKIVVNDVAREDEAYEAFNDLTWMTDHGLEISADFLGFIPHDPGLREAVCLRRLFCQVFPDGPAARGLRRIALRIAAMKHNPLDSDLGFLWRTALAGSGSALAGAAWIGA
jgi:flagellar biosynthesis protein FlhG